MRIVQATCEQLPLRDNSIDMIFTDPPYPAEYLNCYAWLAREAARVLKPGGFVFAMAGGYHLNKIYRMFDAVPALIYFWEFHHRSNGDAPYIWPRFVVAKTKVILAYSKGESLPRIKSVLSMFESTSKSKKFHAWGQDVESARYYIDYFSGPDQLILDPFIGGGTTAVACELIGRRWIAFDIDPKALIITRERMNQGDILHSLPLFGSAKSQDIALRS